MLALPLGLVCALSACGSSTAAPATTSSTSPAGTTSTTTPSAALALVRASVAATTGAGTAQFTSVSTTGAGSGAHPTVVTMTGAIDFSGPDVSSTNTVSLPAGQSPATSAGDQVHSLYFGATGTVYVSTAGPDGPWQKGPSGTPFAYLAPVTPRQLSDAAGPVTVLGPTVVDGVAATGYAVPIAAQVQKTSVSGATTTLHTAPYVARVWLDAEGRIVRTTGTFRATLEPAGSSYTETETTTLSAFGTPVSITPPAVSTRG